MDLIDKDKLDSFKYRSASERMDLPVDYMVGWNDAVDGIMANAPTVEAIPINWILDYKDKYTVITSEECDPVKAEVIADMLAEWKERKEE